MSKNLFITGTGTDVGKTYISALIVKKLRQAGYNVGYFKAAASGNERGDTGEIIPMDAKIVKDISGIDDALCDMVPYSYEAAVSPHLACRMEGRPVDMGVVSEYYKRLCAKHEYITMEGSGGILCPIVIDSHELWLEDIIKAFAMPCIIVADAGLGTINHTVLTAEYMRSRDIKTMGVILNHYKANDIMISDNIAMIEQRAKLPVLCCVKDGDTELDINAAQLCGLYI